MSAYRPVITGTRHMISAGHHAAAHAGFNILEAGGNAIDAGVAAGIALGVLQTDRVNFAGVAPIMIYLAKEREGRQHRRTRHVAARRIDRRTSTASTAARCRPASCAP